MQLTTKIRLSSFSRAASESAPSESTSSVSPSPTNAQTLRVGLLDQPAILQIPHEARLVDRVERANAHRNRRETPEIRHQPRVRIGREPGLVAQFVTEIQQLLVVEATFEIGARVDTPGEAWPWK